MFRFLLFINILLTNVFAHPHTFIEVYPSIVATDNKTTSIGFKWKMDEMTSTMLIMEFDSNGNGKIDKKENQYIYDNYFLELVDYNFYTNIKINGKIQRFSQPIDFKATIENMKVCYSFKLKENYNTKRLAIEFGDEDFFVAMILKKEFVKTKGIYAKVLELDNEFFFGYRLEFEGGK